MKNTPLYRLNRNIPTVFCFLLFTLLSVYFLPVYSQSCTGQVSTYPYLENFETGFGLWTQATDDNFDWTRQSGGTPNAGTGPTEAAEGSYYLYTNSGPNHPWKKAGIISPCFDLTGKGGGIFTFSYHMNGSTMGWLELFASNNNGSTWNKIWGAGGTGYGTNWIQYNVDVSEYAGQKVKFKFVVTMNSQPTSDIAIDEVSLKTIASYQPPVLSNENYILTRTYQTPLLSPNFKANRDVVEEVTYFDGLGRPKQHIAIKASPVGEKDIVTHIDYDEFGRKTKNWLPYYADNGSLGSFRGDISGNSQQFYLDKFPDDFDLVNVMDVNSYSETVFEPSPLNRPIKQGAPGKDWKVDQNSTNDNTVQFIYQTNQVQEVRLYQIDLDGNYTPTLINLSTNEFYPAGQLYKTITRDENWTNGKNNSSEEFKDKQGRVVLKKNYANIDMNGDGDTSDPGEFEAPHDTYYIYDNYGNLTFVLPPKAEPTATNVALSPEKLNNLCYQYKYDNLNRLIEKRVPGKDPEYIIYNKLDQPIMTQDGNQRIKSPKEWLFTKYDAFGRLTFTGIAQDNRDRTTIQAEADAYTGTLWSERGPESTLAGTMIYYSNTGYPNTTITEVLIVNYYDDYNFPGLLSGITLPTESYGVPVAQNIKGLPSFVQTKVLGTNLYIKNAIKYDVKGRETWRHSKNEFFQTDEITSFYLNFSGKEIESYVWYSRNGYQPIAAINYFTYDHRGRQLKHGKVLKDYGFPMEVIAENSYDELGQLVEKGVGNIQGKNRLQNVKYDYNVRGWLKMINDPTNLGDDLFGFEMNYNDPKAGATALFNGNISETHWNSQSLNTTNNPKSHQYKYSYDALNRITGAIDNTGNYNLGNVSYDKMGNILYIQREGHLNAYSTLFGNMDALTYGYENNSNKLQTVNDAGNGAFGFKNGSTAQVQFGYDLNGNLITDTNKGITTVLYNYLNMPTQVTVTGTNAGLVDYTYSADGIKLQKKKTQGGVITTTDYAGNFIYENNSLKQFYQPEGYVENNAGAYKYHYQYKDHLGNVRLTYADLNNNGTIDPSSEILDEKNYYPFGGEHAGYNTLVKGTYHPYGFGGKEENDELGLQWMDFGARNYDKWLGRWMNVDPLAEKREWLSPYNYVQNSPIVRIDPTGALDTYGLDDNGNVRHIDDQKYYDSNGNEVDRLYKMDSKYDVDKTGDYVESKVRDNGSSIVSDLSHSGKAHRYSPTSEVGGPTFTANKYIAYADGSEKNEVNKIYDFASQNSKVEWGLIGFNDNDGNFSYQIGTLGLGGLEGQLGMSYSPSLPRSMGQGLYSIHSHPGENGYQNRLESVDGDKDVGPQYLNRGYKSYQIYFPGDNKTWSIDRYGRESANVKRIRF